jgi:hypothetical protein
MHVVDMTRFAIGVGFIPLGLALLWVARGERGFGQRKQLGLLFLAAAGLFMAKGMGWINLGGLFG